MKRVLSVFFTLILAVMLLPMPVYAATETETLDGIGIDVWPSGADYTTTFIGGADYTVLNSNDDATSYIQYTYAHFGSGGYRSDKASYDTTAFASSYIAINSVTATMRVYHNHGSADTHQVYYRTAASTYLGTSISVPNTTWTTVSHTWTTCPATGVAWTAADINNNEFGYNLTLKDWAGYHVRVSFLSVVVDYTAATAPTVTTQAVSSISETTATGNGNVTYDGGDSITERGTVISTSANPTTADHKDTAAGTTGAYTTSITALTKNTLYHVRAYAINAIGTSYGADVEFTTLTDPTISTVAASQVAATTARLNGNVTFDGREAGTVSFVYKSGTGYANYAAILAAGGTQTAVAGTWTTGQQPYLDISSLTVSTTYSFAVKIVNSVSTAYGSVLTFTTKSGISQPTNLTALPSSTTISLTWTKGSGSTYSLLRYSPAEYPATTTSGSMGYLGTGNSVKVTGLTPGTTYYWSAWGMSGGTYSDNYTTTLCTTLAYDVAGSTNDIETSNTTLTDNISAAKVTLLPWAQAFQDISDANGMPVLSIWYIFWFAIGVGGGIILYTRMPGQYNINATVIAEALWFGFGVTMGLLYLLIPFIFILVAIGFILFGQRH